MALFGVRAVVRKIYHVIEKIDARRAEAERGKCDQNCDEPVNTEVVDSNRRQRDQAVLDPLMWP